MELVMNLSRDPEVAWQLSTRDRMLHALTSYDLYQQPKA